MNTNRKINIAYSDTQSFLKGKKMTENAKQPNKLFTAFKENTNKIRTRTLAVAGTVAALAVVGFLAYTKSNQKEIDVFIIEPTELSDNDVSAPSTTED